MKIDDKSYIDALPSYLDLIESNNSFAIDGYQGKISITKISEPVSGQL